MRSASPFVAAPLVLATLCALGATGCGDSASGTLPNAPPPDMVVLGPPDLVVSCPKVFPTFNKHCKLISDCIVADHQVDGCGSLWRMGINKGDQAIFNTAEALCRMQTKPLPGCPANPTRADDGNLQFPGKSFGYSCVSNTCSTFVR